MDQLANLLEMGVGVNHKLTLLICVVANRDEWTSWPSYLNVNHVLTLYGVGVNNVLTLFICRDE